MAHLACKEFVCFLGLLALGDVKEDAEHDAVGYVSVVALPRADIQRMSLPDRIRKSISYAPMTARVAANADLTRSRSAG